MPLCYRPQATEGRDRGEGQSLAGGLARRVALAGRDVSGRSQTRNGSPPFVALGDMMPHPFASPFPPSRPAQRSTKATLRGQNGENTMHWKAIREAAGSPEESLKRMP
jgi:hypothetical protein